MHFLAIVTDPENDATEVEIMLAGQGTGLYLYDDGTNGDTGAGDGVYQWLLPDLGPTSNPVTILLELEARDLAGNHSHIWPYLVVED